MRESLGQYRTRDGKWLSFRKWSGSGDVIIYIHGIESNSGWFSYFASRLNNKGFTLYGIDRRGSGLNNEGRGDISDYNIFLDDIEDALGFAREENPGKKIFFMGICWGGILAVNYAANGRSAPDGLILLSPAIYRKVDLNGFIKVIAKACLFIYPKARFKIPIRDHMFTACERYLDFIKKDKMRMRSLTCRFFNEILRMERELTPISHKIRLPVAVLLAGNDEIVDNKKIEEWFKDLESDNKAIRVFDGLHHVMPFEKDIDPLVNFIDEWAKIREMPLEHKSFKN
jgi:alpha-beta hydrolase superfamily lysophospholipase